MPKTPIQCAVNYYVGNYCYRKCFRHKYIIDECLKKFDILSEKLQDSEISIKEFNHMIKHASITICRLPFEKRVEYVSWKRFEYYKWKSTDYWDLENEDFKPKR